jgi:hypothetical protein
MIDMECAKASNLLLWWAVTYGEYKIARYNAVKAGLIPETPQFDVETAR